MNLIFCEDVSNEKEKLISKLTHALHNSIRLIRVQPPIQILILLSAFSRFVQDFESTKKKIQNNGLVNKTIHLLEAARKKVHEI